MNKYLFVLNDDSMFFTEDAKDFAMAINQLAVYTGTHSPLFAKAMNGMEDDKDMIELFNHFAYNDIQCVYKIKKCLYKGGEYIGEEN